MACKLNTAVESRIHDLLRDTLCIMCNNTVPFNVHVSVDALIGITIDDNEVILVKIHEQLNKQHGHQLHFDSSSAQNNGATNNDDCLDNENTDELQQLNDDGDDVICEDEEEQEEEGEDIKGLLAIKEEKSSSYYGEVYDSNADMYSVDDTAQSVNTKSEYTEYFRETAKGEVLSVSHSEQGPAYGSGRFRSTPHTACRPRNKSLNLKYQHQQQPATLGGSLRQRSRTNVKRPRVNFGKYTPNEQEVTDYRQTDNVSAEQVQSTSKPTTAARLAVSERATVYTCSICGQIIRHLTTFLRHKQGHEGVFYRCDICGSMLGRQDTLKVHRRKCLARMEQQQQYNEPPSDN